MTLEEIKNKVKETLKTVFQEQFYVYETDEQEELERLNGKIDEIVNKIALYDNAMDEETILSLFDQGFSVLSENISDEDIKYLCEDKSFELVKWGKNDRFWYIRKKESIHDGNSENYIDLK